MIKLGHRHEAACLSLSGITLRCDGEIVFRGSGILGNGSAICVKRGARLEFGRNFGMTGETKIHCHEAIKIGDNFSCSWQVEISDTDMHSTTNMLTGEPKPETRPVAIGAQVWVCQHSMIAKGTVLPSWTTLASHSLANKAYDAEPYTVIAGMPAKPTSAKIRRNDVLKVSQSNGWMITRGLRTFG